MLVIVLLLFTIFPLWNCTGFYLAMCQKKKVFSVLPIYLESTSKNGCYAALVTVPVYMTEHLRETVEEKDWLGCMGPLIMASFSISRHTVRQNTMEGEYRAAVVCFMLGRKMKGTKKKTKDQVEHLKILSVLLPSTILHHWKFSEFSKIAPPVGNYIVTK